MAAVLLLVVSLVGQHYVSERRGESPGTNVILAPSSIEDVPMDRGNAERSGVMPGPAISDGLALSWSFEVGRDGISAPVVVGDTIFVTSGLDPIGTSADQGSVLAIDASNGSERWRFPTEHAISATPAVAGGIVYAGDVGGTVYALDAKTGEERWRKALPSGWTSEPAVVGDAVFIAAVSAQMPLHVAVQDGTVVVGSGFVGQPADGFRLYSFDRLTGNERWNSGDDHSGQPGLFAFDSESGSLAWSFAMPSLESGPAIDNGYVFAGSSLDATIYAIDLASGEDVWQAPIDEDLPLNSSPAVSAGSVFVTTAFGTIYALDEWSGEVRWQANAEHASLNSSAVVVGNTVYVVDTAYGVSAFSANDGEVLWSEQLELTGQVVVSPVVVNGTLYIGTSLNANTAYAATLWALAGPDGG
jgi:outer membrane protein assembly factor BamB